MNACILAMLDEERHQRGQETVRQYCKLYRVHTLAPVAIAILLCILLFPIYYNSYGISIL